MRSGTGAHQGGAAAEEAAERLYLDAGARLRASRWRCPEGEIDLIFEQAGLLIFVEVKARRSLGQAGEALGTRQIRRLGAAASRYLADAGLADADCRFDVVLVGSGGQIERIENAFGRDGW